MGKILLLMLLMTASQWSVSSTQSSNPNQVFDYYLAIKGGVSLGSYESGINWSVLKQIQKRGDFANLKAFSGASAGSINSLLSVAEYCQNNPIHVDAIVDNVMRKSWDLGLPEMLKHQADSADIEAGVLTRMPLLKVVEDQIKPHFQSSAQKCSFIITMSVTMMEPLEVPLHASKQTVSLQRFVVPLRVEAEPNEPIRFYNFDYDEAKKVQNIIPGPFLKLAQKSPHDGKQEISFEDVINLAFASSAFPVAFEPVELSYCFTNTLDKGEPCTQSKAAKALFSDGGLFDNSPIGVAHELVKDISYKIKDRKSRLVFINPDHYRTFNSAVHAEKKHVQHELSEQPPGLAEFGSYLVSSFDTATAEIYKQTLIDFEMDEDQRAKLIITTRHHNLMADFHAHFGALYSPDFRMHDYLVGVYDGQYLLFEHLCGSDDLSDALVCREQKMAHWIDSLKSQNSNYPKQLDFLDYLYRTEFKYKVDEALRQDNIYIALAESFSSSSRYTSKINNESFEQYLIKLRKRIKGMKSIHKHTSQVVNSYRHWVSDNINLALNNLFKMQNLSSRNIHGEKNANATIETILKTAKPVITSYMSYYKSGTWPLAFDSIPNVTHSLRYGFDISEKSQELEFATRVRVYDGWTIDGALSFNRFGGELNDDHYWSVYIGPTVHTNIFGINTFGFGYEHAAEGKQEYKDSLTGAYIAVGTLNEILGLRLSRRLSSFDPAYSNLARERTTLGLTFDITKILRIAFGK